MTGYRAQVKNIGGEIKGEKIFFPSYYFCRKSVTIAPSNIYERYCGNDKTLQEFLDLFDENGYSPFGYTNLEFRNNGGTEIDYNYNYYVGTPWTEEQKEENKYVNENIPLIQCVYWIDDKGNYINLDRLRNELSGFDFFDLGNTEETNMLTIYKRPAGYMSLPAKGENDKKKTFLINDEKENLYGLQTVVTNALGRPTHFKCYQFNTETPWYSDGTSSLTQISLIGQNTIGFLNVAPFLFINRSWKSGYVDGVWKQVYVHILCFCCYKLHPEVIL